MHRIPRVSPAFARGGRLLAACLLGVLLLAGRAALASPAGEAPPGFLSVDEVVVAVAVNGEIDGYITVDAAIEFADPASAQSARSWMPRIVDTWLRTVHGLARRGYFRTREVDPDLLKRHLMLATRESLPRLDPRDIVLTRALYMRAY